MTSEQLFEQESKINESQAIEALAEQIAMVQMWSKDRAIKEAKKALYDDYLRAHALVPFNRDFISEHNEIDTQFQRGAYKSESDDAEVDVTRYSFETQEYRKTATINAIQLTSPFRVTSKEGVLKGNPGDWLAIAHDDSPLKPHRWIISKEDFDKTYAGVRRS
jgi:hypothetical protein